MKDFAYISKKLDEISLAIDSLNLWVDKTSGEQRLNLELLNAEKEKLKSFIMPRKDYDYRITPTAVSIFKVELIYRNCYHIFIRIFQVKEDMRES